MMTKVPQLQLVKKYNGRDNRVIFCSKLNELKNIDINADALKLASDTLKKGGDKIHLNLFYTQYMIVYVGDKAEKMRLAGAEWAKILKTEKVNKFLFEGGDAECSIAFLEGFASQFYDYSLKSDFKRLDMKVEYTNADLQPAMDEFSICWQAIYANRDLVNMPFNKLGVAEYHRWAEETFKQENVSLTTYSKKDIIDANMEGLLTVNKGSFKDPGFIKVEYKPKNASNKAPIVFVGKGVVYDTGGLSLKPTAHSMDIMKCDMGGSASVLTAMLAIIENKLPVHVVALAPLTDNRPGNDAICPGDVITYKNGKTVEILNTDAEGRLILADGLIEADTYNPELVISMATLTGSAARAIGKYAAIGMGNCPSKVKKDITNAGETSNDRVVDFPFWSVYGEEIKSQIADIKNIGGAEAGMITAGKFLEHFTKSPYYHIDIAGNSFIESPYKYYPAGGTGAGTMLLYTFIKNRLK